MEILKKSILTLLIFCVAGVSAVMAQSDKSLIRDGNKLYDSRKYDEAEVNYRKALEQNKDMLHGPFNLGDALYKQDRFDEAAEQYRIAASKASEANVKSEALHNLGNALLKNQKFPESIASYKEALKLNPKDAETKYNLEYAKAMLKQQQQQNQDKKDEKKKDEQKKEDQKKDQQQQDQQQQKQDQQQQQQQKKQEISKADAERILEALKNEEKNVKKKLQKKVPARVQVEKDW